MGCLLLLLHFFTDEFYSNIFPGSFVNAFLYDGESSPGKKEKQNNEWDP